ncbi:MAG: hypothetical protein CBB71_18960 [Rhodopirellula sp. TMED11]|nr:MAG: hypothetical protein CBB71_18960 [Rhodopirellula sp. TMED11]
MRHVEQPASHEPCPDISVIVPVRNGEKDVRECLARIQRSHGCSFEVIVVDDASTDRTAIVSRRMGARVITLEHQSGPAAARNHAIGACRGKLLIFIDCDVMITEDTLQAFKLHFEQNNWSAAFGSYDPNPKVGNLVSKYKNLMHHFFHQQSAGDAGTFWSGCGAIRKKSFEEIGGFNEQFKRPSIEDIELGMRLKEAGLRIGSLPGIQVQHTKRWTPQSLLYTDVWMRGVPWTRLMLSSGTLQNQLNVSVKERICVIIAVLSVFAFVVTACYQPVITLMPIPFIALLQLADLPDNHRGIRRYTRWLVAGLLLLLIACCVVWQPMLALVLLGVLTIAAINCASLRFLMNAEGIPFGILCLPLHVIYYIYCGFSFAVGSLFHLCGIPVFKDIAIEQDVQLR